MPMRGNDRASHDGAYLASSYFLIKTAYFVIGAEYDKPIAAQMGERPNRSEVDVHQSSAHNTCVATRTCIDTRADFHPGSVSIESAVFLSPFVSSLKHFPALSIATHNARA